MAKKSVKILNKKLGGRTLGKTEFNNKGKATKVTVDVKKHRGDKKELASTIKHELLHVKHPKMTEKEVYKKSAKTRIKPKEERSLVSKLKGSLRSKVSKAQKDIKAGKKVSFQPGELLRKAQDIKKEESLSLI